MSELTDRLIRLAYEKPRYRKDLLPLIKEAKSFEEAVEDKKFKNPETGNEVKFESSC